MSQRYENHIFQWWMHEHFAPVRVEDVRAATKDPLVHAVLDWLTLPGLCMAEDKLKVYGGWAEYCKERKNMAVVTGEDMMRAVQNSGELRLHLRTCSICDYQIDYIIIDGQPYLDTGCHCVRTPSEPRRVSWHNVARNINIQPSIEARNRIRQEWGLPLEEGGETEAQKRERLDKRIDKRRKENRDV